MSGNPEAAPYTAEQHRAFIDILSIAMRTGFARRYKQELEVTAEHFRSLTPSQLESEGLDQEGQKLAIHLLEQAAAAELPLAFQLRIDSEKAEVNVFSLNPFNGEPLEVSESFVGFYYPATKRISVEPPFEESDVLLSIVLYGMQEEAGIAVLSPSEWEEREQATALAGQIAAENPRIFISSGR